MRTITDSATLNIPAQAIWDLFFDIDSYQKYVGYCLSAKAEKPIREGSRWADWSLVIGIPFLVHHEIIKISEDEFIYRIPLFGGGEMFQKFRLKAVGENTLVEMELNIDFKNKLLDQLLGGWVEYRNKKMMNLTLKKVESYYAKKQAH